MNTSPPSKRTKLDPSQSQSPSPSPNDEDPKENDDDNVEQEHCTICLQSFLDRTIIPVCAHEFCFECILLWSEQSRKCPLCSRSFDDSYLIHHIRSQYDYQKHYLLPLRSSPSLPLTTQSRANVLRNTRRERQWGRRQRRQREEADQLERAIARRRWIYQHHLYAKHIASNPYTRYRPFPTPAQFAASPDLISRMTTFLRRELRVWLNLDVEFLTTYTISLMKSIDIRSESAVKLLSEFLDLDTPYTAGWRHVNAEHFAHEIYSYLRSPYRDLNTYDQTAQYDTPPEITPPEEIERGRRWSAEPSPSRQSRSQSGSRYRSLIPHRENSAGHSPATRHGTDSSAESRREDGSSRRHSRDRSPRSIPPDREDRDSRNLPSGRRHSPLDGIQVALRNGHSHPGGMSFPAASSSAVLAENQDNNLPVQPHVPSNEKEESQVRENIVAATAAQRMSAPQGGDSAAALAVGGAGVARLIDGPPCLDYVDKVRGGSSANPPPSRKRQAGLSVHVHPRNRTLSESVQAYLCRPAAPQHSTKKPSVSGNEQPMRVSDSYTMDARPSLLLRLTDSQAADPDMGILLSPPQTSVGSTANGGLSTPDNTTSEQLHPGCRSQSCVSSMNCYSSTIAEHADTIIQRGDRVDGGAIRLCRLLPSTDDEPFGVSPSGDRSPGRLGFPPVTRNAYDVALSHALALKGSLVDGRPGSVQMRHDELLDQGRRFHMVDMGAARGTGDQARHGDDEAANDDADDLRSNSLGSAAASASVDDHEHKRGQDHGCSCTNKDTWPGVAISAGAIAAGPSFFHGGERAACQAGDVAVGGGLGEDASMDGSTFGSGSGSVSRTSTQTSRSTSTDADGLELETRLRMRARLRVRLAAMKGTGGVVSSVGSLSLSGGSRSGLGMDSGMGMGSGGVVSSVGSLSLSGGSRSGLGMDSGMGMGSGSGSGSPGTSDDSTVRRVDRMRDPSVGVVISGDRDGDGDGPYGDRGGTRDKDKDKVERLKLDRDQEREREVALRGMLMLRERAGRGG